MRKQGESMVGGQSRREFIRALGVGVPSLALLGGGTGGDSAGVPDNVEFGERGRSSEGGDPSYKHLTLDEVARTRHEVHYEEIAAAYGGPISRGPLISERLHPEIVWVRPDMGIGMVANPVAFGTGSPPGPIRWRGVERSLQKGYLPIVISQVREGVLKYEQVAYATLLEGGEVKTGHEKQVVMVRMSVMNTDPTESQRATWWAYVPATVATMDGQPYWWSYELFEVTGSLPAVPAEAIPGGDDVLRDGVVLLGVHEEGPGVKVTRYEKVLKFEMELLPGQKKSVNLKLSSNKKGFTEAEIGKLRKLDYFTGRDQRELELEEILRRGMKIQVPEEVVNNIYRAQILYNQTHLVQARDRDYYMPVDTSEGVWPWSQMRQLTAMDEYGYHEDVRKSLIYFLKIQGKRAPNDMKVKSYEGVFPSSATFDESGWEQDSESTIYGLRAKERAGKKREFPNWVSNTGCVLYAFGEHYFYTRDRRWLESVSPPLIKACDWIINERQATKEKDAQGQKALHYGLLPPGQPYDTEAGQKASYYFCFTDGLTYKGLRHVAEAFAQIGHPEGRRLLDEAESYRQDILEVMRRTRQTDPNLPPYPEHLHGPDQWGSFASGAINLVDAGLLDPHDPAFVQLEGYMKKNLNLNILGLTGRCRQSDDERTKGSYYVVQSDFIYHNAWVTRGEIEKALLAFYSALSFGVDKETLAAVERFMLLDRRYTPFFTDTPHLAELCSMIRRSILMEHGSDLLLLAGAPRRWLEAGKKIEVEDAPMYFGKMSLRVESQVDKEKIAAELEMHMERPEGVQNIRLRLPHPTRQRMKQVTVNGTAWKNFDAEQEVIELKPSANRYEILAQY